MKRNERELDVLLDRSRRAPVEEPPAQPPGFAARVARIAHAASSPGRPEDILTSVFRWAIPACAAVTIIVAILNGPSIVITGFIPDTAYESHVSDLVLLEDE